MSNPYRNAFGTISFPIQASASSTIASSTKAVSSVQAAAIITPFDLVLPYVNVTKYGIDYSFDIPYLASVIVNAFNAYYAFTTAGWLNY